MNSLWLRRLIRRHDTLGHLVAGLFLIGYYLLVRKRKAMLIWLSVLMPLLLLVWSQSLAAWRVHRSLTNGPANYKVTDLGTLRGVEVVVPTSVNSNNQVVGVLVLKDDTYRGFAWQSGKFQELGGLGGKNILAYGINDSGLVVGLAETRSRAPHAVVWQNGRVRDLASKPDEISGAESINGRGQIVGWIFDPDTGTSHATLWEDGKPKDLGTLPGDKVSFASGINARGEVVGTSTADGEVWRPFLYRQGKLEPLPMPGKSGFVEGINDSGQAVGVDLISDEEVRAFVTQSGKVVDLGTLGGKLSVPYGINNSGQVVGWSTTAGEDFRPFVWQSGKIVDLNTRIPSRSGWQLVLPSAVGNSGQIAGLGIHNRELRAFLLMPE